ncbi:hypothetical protein K504DRAFT_446296 [Pleomassaria siparia CBS 279.74]|uniref:Uncharacterized protein n=1 Tax=Pleomassaria siparia CBS 279.74 TaxID=1314801 RepID=A0A6G1KSA4_9PLEO|nr:hypothetical protein K504DRAFT_446296 [Pleomassaria siparia CBS 279.74]
MAACLKDSSRPDTLPMSCTTLVTFLFDCPSAVRSVELLGSWDNFSTSYPLKQDRRKGTGIWSGCYTFDNIICDGDVENIGATRNGALKMGGTYWYYVRFLYMSDMDALLKLKQYNVDDEERHNSSEPSTTLCPLLPGQRLNILEVPMESQSSNSPHFPDAFTRNPADKFQTPVPPKQFPSPRLGDLCTQPYTVPMQSVRRGPRSATHPPPVSMSHGFEGHARSASSPSTQTPRGAVYTEFKGLKDRFVASKRSVSPNQRELQIGAPVLVSSTAEDVDLIPLSRTSASLRRPRTPLPPSPPSPAAIATLMREYSPLGSHPVEPRQDFDCGFSDHASSDVNQPSRRSRSRPSSNVITLEQNLVTGRARANSADTRRTRHYLSPNEPWVSTPKNQDRFENELAPAPVLQRPAMLEPPSTEDRPSSRNGGDRSPSLRRFPINIDKDLPPLPQYLVPAPLYTCSPVQPSPQVAQDEEEQIQQLDTELVPLPELEQIEEFDPKKEFENRLVTEKRGHFSTWSTESSTLSIASTNEDDAINSPTFSSLPSDYGSPERTSEPFTHGDQTYDLSDKDLEDSILSSLSSSPPQLSLDPLHISTFGSGLLNMNMQIHHDGSAPRRQAVVFGLGFQGYSLPDDETEGQSSLVKMPSREEPAIVNSRVSSVSHLSKMMNEFGYLMDAVA